MTYLTHELKILPEYFSAVCSGVKKAELRKNDHDYQVGDSIILKEWVRGEDNLGSYTGRSCVVIIQHIANVTEYAPGYVLLSIDLPSLKCFPVARPGGSSK
ncbi:DUF3850 domain-containing protein [Rahnella aceris]|jgi:hypothetical protein|uniref:DUF3850 domain-containing protein n=1 Tax=Rahnella sp. (strain Y9602) TaxID=2703885 RepID=UPI003FD272BF